MYNHQGKNSFHSSTASVLPERHLFQQGTNMSGDTGLVLSTDAKPRLKWTPELHERFIEAVNHLGGADKATPKTIMRIMGIPGLTLYHLKSHLQKYRLSKNLQAQNNTWNNKNGSTAVADRISEKSGSHLSNTNLKSLTSKNFEVSEALQMQIEVQRRLHEQLEVQRHLQLSIEAQGKYLQSVLEKAQETLGRQNLGSAGLEAAKVQLSELVSKVSTECLNSGFADFSEMQGFRTRHTPTTQIADCSMDSSLTSCEGSQKDQEMHNSNICFNTLHFTEPSCAKGTREDSRVEENKAAWCEDPNRSKMFSTERRIFPLERNSNDLSMSIRVQGEKESRGTSYEVRRRELDLEETMVEQPKTKRHAFQLESEKPLKGTRFPYLTPELDLNAHDDNDAASSCKQFDLNGFSWS